MLEIKNGAVFVADAHVNENRTEFLSFLELINSGKIAATQLFLMGDIFDFLTGYGDYTAKFYAKYIDLIEQIALKIDVFYIEGNHDFRLKNLFKNVKIYEISKQPVSFFITENNEKKSVQIAHGDNFLPFFSKYALLFLRLKWFLRFMNFLDILLNFKISKSILKALTKKKLDYKIKNFKGFISPKMRHYNANFVIEGHYHQGEIFNINEKFYINLPTFACEQSFFIVKCQNHKIEFMQKNLKGH